MLKFMQKYRLKDGSIYWHKLYFAVMPDWATRYSPPLGNYNYAAYFYQPHKYVIDIYDQCKWFIQRGRRGYSDCDVWGLDWYLAKWLPKAIHLLRDNKIGHPLGMTAKGWRTRLDKMANGFESAIDIQDMRYKPKSKEERMSWKRFNRGMKLFHEHFFSLWD